MRHAMDDGLLSVKGATSRLSTGFLGSPPRKDLNYNRHSRNRLCQARLLYSGSRNSRSRRLQFIRGTIRRDADTLRRPAGLLWLVDCAPGGDRSDDSPRRDCRLSQHEGRPGLVLVADLSKDRAHSAKVCAHTRVLGRRLARAGVSNRVGNIRGPGGSIRVQSEIRHPNRRSTGRVVQFALSARGESCTEPCSS